MIIIHALTHTYAYTYAQFDLVTYSLFLPWMKNLKQNTYLGVTQITDKRNKVPKVKYSVHLSIKGV
jgi:type II secretory pathway component PulM